MSIAGELHVLLDRAVREIGVEGARYEIEEPANPAHGDLASNVALTLSKALGRPPRQVAEALAAEVLRAGPAFVTGVEVAGPGFLNFRVSPAAYQEELHTLLQEGERFFRPELGGGERVQVEFVSANPTGPLHIGNGWLGTYGDALARLLSFAGYQVVREYYVNDTGGQIRTLGASILAARKGEALPEEGYKGDYVFTLAASYSGPDDVVAAGRWAVPMILEEIKESLESLGIGFDSWFSQASIEDSGAVADVVRRLEESGSVYEQEGALWFEATRFKDSRDRVLRKSNGDYTYLAGDIAYHYNKLAIRGFDLVVDVFGADHHGQVSSIKAAMEALGIDPTRLDIRIGQMVSLLEEGEAVKFSKRAGTAIPLTWLVEELGADATRLLILSSSIDRAAQVDLARAKATSMDNPVYYMQYAHARIAALFRNATERGVLTGHLESTDLSALVEARELELLKQVLRLGQVVEMAVRERAPHKVTAWLMEVSAAFHRFYHDLTVLGAEANVRDGRLALVRGTQIALQTAFSLLGVTPLEEM